MPSPTSQPSTAQQSFSREMKHLTRAIWRPPRSTALKYLPSRCQGLSFLGGHSVPKLTWVRTKCLSTDKTTMKLSGTPWTPQIHRSQTATKPILRLVSGVYALQWLSAINKFQGDLQLANWNFLNRDQRQRGPGYGDRTRHPEGYGHLNGRSVGGFGRAWITLEEPWWAVLSQTQQGGALWRYFHWPLCMSKVWSITFIKLCSKLLSDIAFVSYYRCL